MTIQMSQQESERPMNDEATGLPESADEASSEVTESAAYVVASDQGAESIEGLENGQRFVLQS